MKFDVAKRIALCATVFGMVGAVTSQAIVPENQRELDIIIRDFDVSHPDFENFQEEAYNSLKNRKNFDTWTYPGYGCGTDWALRRTADCKTHSVEAYNLYGCGNTQTPMYGIPLSVVGYPYATVTQLGQTSTTPEYIQGIYNQSSYAWYGEFSNCQKDANNPGGLNVMRGLVADLCADTNETKNWTSSTPDDKKNCNKTCKTHGWSQIVYITPGMVEQKLKFPAIEGGALDMYEPTITRARYACDNQFFEQWYADVPEFNKRTNATLILDQDPNAPLYFEIDRNWNNGGYFPLDSLDDNQGRVINQAGVVYPSGRANQYGPQSLSIFCPPYKYQWASSQKDYTGEPTSDLCEAWLKAGGPKTGTAASAAATGAAGLVNGIGLRHLRNYGFTMMGYAAFKYKKGAGEVFKFTGDDDMWIFVDGVLVVDLGGTHLAATGTADMDYLSSKGHGCYPGDPLLDSCAAKQDVDGTWQNGSWHHLHFFYADRQSDGSNLRIRSSLSELAPSRYGQPAVGNVVIKVDESGKQTTKLMLNTTLDEETVTFMEKSGQPSILVMRQEAKKDAAGNIVLDPVTGAVVTEPKVYGYYVSSIVFGGDKGASGVLYEIEGELRDLEGHVIEGGILGSDQIAFNFPYDKGNADDIELKNVYVASVGEQIWNEMLLWNDKIKFTVKSSSGKGVVGLPDTPKDWAVVTFTAEPVTPVIPQDTTIDRPDFTLAANELTNKAGSGELPLDFTGDLMLTNLPALPGKDPMADLTEEQILLYTSATETGMPPPGTVTKVGGREDGAQTRCYSSNGVESCASWAFATSGPFRVNVRVFDHLGHFVSQYQQTVSAEEFEKALDAGNGGRPSGVCYDVNGKQLDQHGSSGGMLVTVKMYPVSQNGRMLATGPYVYQMTIIKEKYEHCYMSQGASSVVMTDQYQRTNKVYRRGYRRVKVK